MRAKSEKAKSTKPAKKAEVGSRRRGDAATGKARAAGLKDLGLGKVDPQDYSLIAQKIFELGGTEADIAEALNVKRETIFIWRKSSQEFKQACKQGLEKANSEIQRSLFKMANGYERIVEDFRFHQGRVIRTKYSKWFPPNFTAAKNWLLNRYPEKWNGEPEPEQEEDQLGRLFRSIEGTVLRPVDESGTPEPFSLLSGEADYSEKEAEIEKEKEMERLGLSPHNKEHRFCFNRCREK